MCQSDIGARPPQREPHEIVRRRPFHESLLEQFNVLCRLMMIDPSHGIEGMGWLLELLNSTAIPAKKLPEFTNQLLQLWECHEKKFHSDLRDRFMESLARLKLYLLDYLFAKEVTNEEFSSAHLPDEIEDIASRLQHGH